MAKYKCSRTKNTKTKVCADYNKKGKCIRKKTVKAKRCADYSVKGKIKKGLYGGHRRR